MKKEIGAILAAAVLLAVIAVCRRAGNEILELATEETSVMPVSDKYESRQVILDPGHGGKDPGKVGANGEKEKDINLEIAHELKEFLEQKGIRVSLTRSEDERLGETQGEDLKKRAELIDSGNPVLAVSIHQNSYSDSRVRGPQIFYYEHSQAAEEAGRILQKWLEETLPEYARDLKSNTTYYLLKNTASPVIILECGFLSCPEEANLLTDPEYRAELVEAFGNGIVEYVQGR